ncbi:MAG: sulfite exporter TauE/SafE family protein [Flavobacteriaceae bacterium]|nr:sulfite exporter TauE/SafE family protein [Flavobacteriaceae bacterium]
MDITTLLMLLCIGLAAGILSGLVGVGGGIVMVPLLLWIGLSQHEAQGTSLAVLSIPVTAIAALNYYKQGYVDWKYALIIAVFFVVGAFIGSKIAVSIDQKILKKIFGVILLLVAGKMLLGK